MNDIFYENKFIISHIFGLDIIVGFLKINFLFISFHKLILYFRILDIELKESDDEEAIIAARRSRHADIKAKIESEKKVEEEKKTAEAKEKLEEAKKVLEEERKKTAAARRKKRKSSSSSSSGSSSDGSFVVFYSVISFIF